MLEARQIDVYWSYLIAFLFGMALNEGNYIHCFEKRALIEYILIVLCMRHEISR